ncbi:MAG: hypothetical protein VB855_14160, partial [Pirellulaceae bacterium]
PYRVPGYPFTPIIFLVFNIWFLFLVFTNTGQSALIGAGLIVVAIPIYYLMRRRWLDPPSLGRQYADEVEDMFSDLEE